MRIKKIRRLAYDVEVKSKQLSLRINDMLVHGEVDTRKEFYKKDKDSYGYRVAIAIKELSDAMEAFGNELDIEAEGEN